MGEGGGQEGARDGDTRGGRVRRERAGRRTGGRGRGRGWESGKMRRGLRETQAAQQGARYSV